MPRLLRSTIVLAIVLILGGCAGVMGGHQLATGTGGPDPSVWTYQAGPAGRIPPGLERYYGQRLTWSGCGGFATTDRDRQNFTDPEFRCTRLQVPLDYAHPDGGTAQIALLRRPADDQQARLGSLLVNPGGPGVSGMAAVAAVTRAVNGTGVGRRFDLVGFDPRGVGASQPRITCRTTQEEDAARLELDLDTSPAGVAKTESENRAYDTLCARRVGVAMLANAGTRDVARDLDVMRSALGDSKLTYLGYSYGTRIGTSYAEQFPGNVRAMVLDGALDPNGDLVNGMANQGAGFQKSFDSFVSWCLGQSPCWLGAIPKDQANERFRLLLLPLTVAALPVGNRELSYSDATIGTIQGLYTDRLWPVLNRGLTELATGGGATLLSLADLYYQRDAHGYSGSQDAFNAVRCVDDPPVTDPVIVQEADRLYRLAAPFLNDGHPAVGGPGFLRFLAGATDWDVRGPSEVEGLPPVLVVSTTGDPATPYQAGVDLARKLRGKLLTFDGNRHTVVFQGVPCVDEMVSDYLVRLVLPKRSSLCVT